MGTFTICQDPEDAPVHSQGPWEAVIKDDGSFFIIAADCMAVTGRDACAPYPERSKANATLIAAAPDLLAMLKVAQFWLDVDGRFDMQGINAAIAKAEGRS